MTKLVSPGQRFRAALKKESPLQIIGTVNAYCALMAERVGYQAIYLSGGACANISYGLPDLAMTTLNDVLADVWRITSRCNLPLMVDIDTGWGNALNINRTIQQMIKAGAAAAHIEDQVSAKRCGHRPNKELVAKEEMVDRLKAAVDAKTDADFYIIARTDAVASEGLAAAIERANVYLSAGADAIFAEALTSLEDYHRFCQEVDAPVLANITEFGKTPLFSLEELKSVGVAMALYPISASRAMQKAALEIYQTIRKEGSQKTVVNKMQTREELYDFLNYHDYEKKIDKFNR